MIVEGTVHKGRRGRGQTENTKYRTSRSIYNSLDHQVRQNPPRSPDSLVLFEADTLYLRENNKQQQYTTKVI